MRAREAVYIFNIDKDDIFNTFYFKNNTKRSAKVSASMYNSNLLSNNGFWGHKLGKVISRVDEPIKLLGNHYVEPLNNNLIKDIEFDFLSVLHFEGMSQECFVEKQFRRLSKEVVVERISERERNRLLFFKKLYESKGELGLLELYNHMHVFNKKRLDDALSSGFLSFISFRDVPISYNKGIEDFHGNFLSYCCDKDFATSGFYKIIRYYLI